MADKVTSFVSYDKETPKLISYKSANEWEILEVPPLIDFSSNEELHDEAVPSTATKTNKKADKERLCGYLWKLGAKGLIKSWKYRWFVYDQRRCLLYYYRKPQDLQPLGNIDIARATFGLSADDKPLFQISSNERVYHLQAVDRNTMMFWLQELQVRRRGHTSTALRPTSGLLSAEVESDNDSDENDEMREPIEKPITIGDTAISHQENQNKWNLSFQNFNKELKSWKKFILPISGEALSTDQSTSTESTFSKFLSSRKSPTNITAPIIRKKDSCVECNEMAEMLAALKEAIIIAEREIKSRDDVIESLNEQLRTASCTSPVYKKSPDEEMFEDREQYISKLSRMIEKLTEDVKEATKEIKLKDDQLEEYSNKEKVLKEMIQAKDNSIVSLTNRIFSLEQPEPGEEVVVIDDEAAKVTLPADDVFNYNQLKEACAAYRSQNNFLNSEILELNRLRKIDTDKLKIINEKLDLSEAEHLKLKSLYLCVLKELSKPQREGSVDSLVTSEMVEHLIDDAINEIPEAEEDKKAYRYSDRYGFYDSYDKHDGDSLQQLADHLHIMSSDKQNVPQVISVSVKWENYLISQGSNPLLKTEELKQLTRSGVPHEFRARVWKDMVDLRVKHERQIAGPGYYVKLLTEKQGVYSPSTKQIELDLLRTLPNNKYYDKINSEGTGKLRRILMAYSWHNPSVGYCQGLNRLGAIALLYLDEESAFWCLVAIAEHLMPLEYYSRTLLGAQVDQKVCRDLIDEKFPKLSNHLQSIKFDISMISFNWFLTVFVDIFPIELTLRVWDTFLFEGSKVLFRYALAVFKLFEDDLLRITDSGRIFDFFRKVPKSKFQIQKIWQIAFTQLNPFSRKIVESKRRYYRPLLQAQLDEFEVMRQEYRDKRHDSDLLGEPNSDDDDI